METPQVLVIKADGEKEIFDREKLRMSLTRAGAPSEVTEKIITHVEGELVGGMTTEDIYRHAFMILSKERRPVAARYSLRRSLAALGPSGFPFERFVAEVFRKRGFETKVGQIVRGTCAPHEIDVIAWNKEELVFVEAKFHTAYNQKSDLKVALYVKARFDDLRSEKFDYGGPRTLTDGLLITNTKFTTTAIEYAQCSGTKLIGWNYPSKGNLQDLVEEAGLHPITCLTTLRQDEKRELLTQGVVLCSSVRDSNVLQGLKMGALREEEVRNESRLLCPLPK